MFLLAFKCNKLQLSLLEAELNTGSSIATGTKRSCIAGQLDLFQCFRKKNLNPLNLNPLSSLQVVFRAIISFSYNFVHFGLLQIHKSKKNQIVFSLIILCDKIEKI